MTKYLVKIKTTTVRYDWVVASSQEEIPENSCIASENASITTEVLGFTAIDEKDLVGDADKAYIQVEYNLDYYGGNYSNVGDFVYIPQVLWNAYGEVAFQLVTGHDPEHIIHWSDDELFTADGEPLTDCANCGELIRRDAEFCPHCNAPS